MSRPASPMYVGAGMVALSVVALGLSRRHLERPGVVAAVAA